MKSPAKTKTIARRLYGMLALLLLMFIGCLALILWTEGRNSRQMVSLLEQREQLEKQSARVRFNMMQMSDAMRGALLDSTNQEEFKRKLAADKDLEAAVAAMQPLVADRPELLSALNAIGEFDAKKLNKFEDELMGMVASDPKAAAAYYVTTYLPVRREEDVLVDTFLTKVHAATSAGIAKSESAKTMGMAAAAGMILLCLLLGRYQVVAVNRSLEGLAHGLAESSAHVSGAATEVASASQSVAEGASQQAASLEETSASLEEMSSMTRRTAASAEDAKQLAAQTRAAADAGAGEMRQMSRAMAEIKAASDNIAKIIKTIDEIAFQTNILALNAAVEAARAGEAGMGFAVVADEVRNLAQRSAQAARETAASIEDSIRKSEAGVQYSAKVAGNLEEIVVKARKVDELIAEIASACHEQNQGITQVNTATMQMDKVTQSNAASAEESASAAEELNAQADTLKSAVEELLGLVGGQKDALAKPSHAGAKAVPVPASNGSVNGRSNGYAHKNGHAPVRARAGQAASFHMPEVQSGSRPPLNGANF